jgi:thiol reductant ABC exporter CydD subunit
MRAGRAGAAAPTPSRRERRVGAGALDPRLLRHARATRPFIALSVVLGVAGAALIVAQARLLADVISGAFLHHRDLDAVRGPLAMLLVVVLARAALAWAGELAAVRAAAAAKSQLRIALLARAGELAPRGALGRSTGELAVLATRGIDALDGYFSLYLPQVVLAVIAPVVVVAAVLSQDWIAATIIALTIPLIPIFMALVGAATRERVDRQLRTLQRLAGHFLDVVSGLPTLKVFGRARAQAQAIGRVTDLYREHAIATFRITFLSSLILELVATVSVAIVAVAIGLRLMSGTLGLQTGLFALILAPEAYLPLRRLGASYHASAEGMAAAEQAFALLDAPAPRVPHFAHAPDPAAVGVLVEDVCVTYAGRSAPAVANASFAVHPGETLALAGPSGCGKSTLLAVLLGLLAPDNGSASVGGREIAELDPRSWHARLAWVPQRPHLFRATVGENVRLGRACATDAQVLAALEAAGLGEVVRELPRGLHTLLGEGGAGLSAGERQRLALARAFLRDAPLLLLDEPTAGLDGDTEREVLESVRRLAHARTVVLVAHRPALLALADRVVRIEHAGVAA